MKIPIESTSIPLNQNNFWLYSYNNDEAGWVFSSICKISDTKVRFYQIYTPHFTKFTW